MSGHIDDKPFPTGALLGGAALILLSLVFAATAKLTDIGATRLTVAPPVATLDLKFNDLEDGSIAIHDASNGREIERLTPGTSGFVRVVMRGLAFERGRLGIGDEIPFRLMKLEDGMSVVSDPATGRVVTLKAFGHGNAEAFERLFEKGKSGS